MRPDSVTSLRPPAPGRADARPDVAGDGFQALLDGIATRPEPRRCGHDAGRRVRGEHTPDRAARHDEGRRAHGRPEEPAEAPAAAPQPPAAGAPEAPATAAVPAVPAADAAPATVAAPVPPMEAAAPACAPAAVPVPQPADEPQAPAAAAPAGVAPADAVPAADEPPAAGAAAVPAAAAPEAGIAPAAPQPEAEPPAALATEPRAQAPTPRAGAGAGDTGGEQPGREQPPAQPAPVPAAQADEPPGAQPQPAQQPPSPAEPAAADPVAPAAPAAPVQPASGATGQPLAAPQRSAPLHHAPRAVAQLLHVAIERSRNADSPISHARINLRPAELGGIEIRLQTSSAGVTAQVVADSPDAARLLHQAADDLRRSLERHDVTLLALDVSTSGDDRSAGSAGAEADLAGDRARELHGAPRGRRHDGQAADEAVVLETVQLPDGVHVDVLA